MSDTILLEDIQRALTRFAEPRMAQPARELLKALGYTSTKYLRGDPYTVAAFVQNFQLQSLNAQRAMFSDWRSVEVIFQLAGQDLINGGQLSMFSTEQVDNTIIESYLFVAIDLEPREGGYTRSELAGITREVNRGMLMPALIIFRHGATLTFAVIDRRLHKRDVSRDVLEKVTLIKDIRFAHPHAAHRLILADLALSHLIERDNVRNFIDLHRAWRRSLDSSELNKRFFRELANWYFWAVSEVEFPADITPDHDERDERSGRDIRNATNVIRLITRLMFVWFLKEKDLVSDVLFERRELRSLLTSLADNESTFYKAILQNLFFATLNTEMNDPKTPRRFRSKNSSGGRDAHYLIPNVYRYEKMFRDPQAALELFKDIPFLNGGLFECLDKPREDGTVERVDGFSDHPKNALHVPNKLFFGGEKDVNLSSSYGVPRKVDIEGLIDILSKYKFTIAENTPIEEEVALDPELLGQVFENLLANYNPETRTTARKQTGSFYTPRAVVEFMSDEALLVYFKDHLTRAAKLIPGFTEERRATLDQRLRDLLGYSKAEPDFSDDEKGHLIAAIDSLKILDPACGSGAFPMGILHKLVYVLARLDPGNKRWMQRQIDRVHQTQRAAATIQDAELRDATIRDLDARIDEITKAFKNNELDYGRKLFLIENCIYGVDIQPIAVQIAKLRCFIALIVDQRVTDDVTTNRNIRPLPNLETRFVAADTLEGVFWQGSLRSDEVVRKERELSDVRSRHFNARTPATKQKYRDRDNELRREISSLLRREGIPLATADRMAQWNPYDQNTYARFFDPEWMFGVPEGFDIVIANPPYVRQEQFTKRKAVFKDQFPQSFTGTADLYVFFYDRAHQLLKTGGVLSFISSNKYFRAGYGQKLRRLLTSSMAIHQLIDFGDAPVFEAIAYPSIIIAQKQRPGDQLVRTMIWEDGRPLADFPQAFYDGGFPVAQKQLTADGWQLEPPTTLRLMEKLRRSGTPLDEYIKGAFYSGIKLGYTDAFVINESQRNQLIAEHSASNELIKPFLRGRDIKRWNITSAGLYLCYVGWETPINKYPAILRHLQQYRKELEARPEVRERRHAWYALSRYASDYWQEFSKPKIIYPDIAQRAEFAYDRNGYYLGNTAYMLPTNQLWLLGLLNSSTIFWFYNHLSTQIRGGFVRWIAQYVAQLPIPATTLSQRTEIEVLVVQVLAAQAAGRLRNVAQLDSEINSLVYQLYELDKEEIALIEGRQTT